MPHSRKNGGRSSASPSPTPTNDQRGAAWMNWQWQSVSDISMSEVESDLPMEYSESEDENAPRLLPTGHSFQHSREMSKSSRIVQFQSSRSFEEEEEEQDENHAQQRKSRKHSKQSQQEHATSRHRRVWNAVSNLASNVTRSPAPKRSPTRTKQYPHHASLGSSNATAEKKPTYTSETSPLLQNTTTTSSQQSSQDDQQPKSRVVFHAAQPSDHSNYELPPPSRRPLKEERAIDICAAFLRDCEHGQRPSLPADLSSITDTLLTLRQWKYSVPWQVLTHVACLALFLSSSLESMSRQQACSLNVFAIVIFTMDMWMGNELRKYQYNASEDPVLVLRHSRVEYWTMPMAIMLFAMTVEMLCTITAPPKTILWTGILKPISIFYLSNKAKNALEALNRIFRIVLRVIVMELFLILSFATVACQLYTKYDSFHDLSTAFLSLFQLSTTVVNPSLWMPMYAQHRTAAFFFVLFVVTSVFYLHSLGKVLVICVMLCMLNVLHVELAF